MILFLKAVNLKVQIFPVFVVDLISLYIDRLPSLMQAACLKVIFIEMLRTKQTQPFQGKEICEGAVTKELSTLVKICDNGKLKLKKKADIAPGWPKAGGGKIYTI